MVGDYFSKMAAAQKLAPEQISKSVKNNVITPNMANDAMNSQPHAAPQSGIQGLQQPPIADQVMQEANQVVAPDRIMQQINSLKSSIAEVQQGVQSGKIEAYKGIPFIKEQLNTLQQLEAKLHPTQGIDSAPSNLPTQEMASGGIVAFDGGGLADENDDEEYGGMSDSDKALFQRFMADTPDEYDVADESDDGEMPEGIMAVAPQANKGTGLNPEKKGASEGIQYTSKKHKYEKEIRAAAKKAGISEDLFLHMMAKETGGLDNPESARSKAGAMGIAQFMPATAKQYGIDPMDMNQALPAAAKMTSTLLKHYGGDQKLAAMAYNWGQGNVDKWLSTGADPSKVPGETQKYIRAAQGGLMSYAGGGVVAFGDPKLNPNEKQLVEEEPESAMGAFFKKGIIPQFSTQTPEEKKFAENYLAQQKFKETQQKALTAPDLDLPFYKAVKPSERQLVEDKRKAILNGNIPAPAPTPTATSTTGNPILGANIAKEQQQDIDSSSDYGTQNVPTEKNTEDKIREREAMGAGEEDIASLREMLNGRSKSLNNQKSIDNYMALLQAGLGMMGGTSPYAAANIGQGASKGIAHLSDARRTQVAEENAILSGRLGISRAQLYEQSRKDQLARGIANDKFNQSYKNNVLGLNMGKYAETQQHNKNLAEHNKILANIKAEELYEKKGGDAKLRSDFIKEYGKNWESDPIKKKLFDAQRNADVYKVFNLATDNGYLDASKL
jgi:hypothetical protein